ncbi:MAG TPA: indole-3-glycerol-phosphate synthase [Acidimicrobiales bacterium]
MATQLDSIVAYHRQRAASDGRRLASVMKAAGRVADPPSLLDALVRSGGEPLRVIAEVKRRSPSAGALAADLDPAALAAAYEDGGAAAISVLTDAPHFGGSPDDVARVRSATTLPVLRKDFTVSGLDVADARIMGASGVLLIVAALSRREVRSFLELADALGITALVEVHDAAELEVALDLGALVVGVNQRDLNTFEIDPNRAESLAASFPSDVVTIAESGIGDADAARRCAELGYDAVLVGEAFVRAADPSSAVAAFRAPASQIAAT